MPASIWPIALIVISNTIYQVCTKSVPEGMDPFASLTVTYLTGAAVSAGLYCALNRHGGLLRACAQTNWAPFVLGIVIVGLEAGYIYAFKARWPVSTASLVQSAILAGVLIIVGALLYGEAITWNKVVGVLCCLVGLLFINR